MGSYRLGVMLGDGIGPGVVPEAAHAEPGLDLGFQRLPVKREAYEQPGLTLPAATPEPLLTFDGRTRGPVSTLYRPDDPAMPNSGAVLRKRFQLCANVRPARSYPRSPALYPDVGPVVGRENTEGCYADGNLREGSGGLKPTGDPVTSVRVAFEPARGRRRVSAVHKTTVLRRGCGLFAEACRAVAQEGVRHPPRFDVLVAENIVGDLLSNRSRGTCRGPWPGPGSKFGAAAARAERAVAGTLADGIGTPDIGGLHRTAEVRLAVAQRVLQAASIDRTEVDP